MPNENKHTRGRRDKRKRDVEDLGPSKRQRSSEPDVVQVFGTDDAQAFVEEGQGESTDGAERPFYGMLDDEEQEYFRRADELLESNDFPSTEERDLFLANVYKEAEGKELKLANSQSCSRLMERLILLSSADQKKKLFERFSGNFLHLIQHRFASHCCETLFIQSAPLVSEELLKGSIDNVEQADSGDAIYVSMENLFLYTLNELEGHLSFLLTDRFASHTLRVLLVVLSGQTLSKASTQTLLQSKKKEKIEISGVPSVESSSISRTVPESFQFAIDKIISDTIAGLDTAFIRVLATHPTGNPALQLLLELELTRQQKGKVAADAKSIISKLLPDDITTDGSESATFVNGLMYEPIGSRLLETIVTFAPGRLFKQIYKTTFKERMGALARNEIASFVIIKVLERLSKEDLEEAVTSILPQISSLVERSRTTVIKTLFQRCVVRKAEKSLKILSETVAEAYGSEPATLLLKMTHFTPQPPSDSDQKPQQAVKPSTEALHGSLLAQTMLAISTSPQTLIQNSILTQTPATLLSLALQTTTSHILQAAFRPSTSPSNLSFRRKLTNALIAEPNAIMTMATSKAGSHTMDALFAGTAGLMSLKERITMDLITNEALLREDFCGRVVWRNWMCDLFKRRRGDWITKVKTGDGGGVAVSASGKINGVDQVVREEQSGRENKSNSRKVPKPHDGKTALEMARERFASSKSGKGDVRAFKPTGSNSIRAGR